MLGLISGVRPWQVGSAVILGLLVIGLGFPRSPLARGLFSQHGPSLEVDRMTRAECWRSALGFLVIAAGSVATIFGLSLLEPWLGRDPWDVPALAALLFMYGLFTIMGLVGAAYLAVRAPFRPRALSHDEPREVGV